MSKITRDLALEILTKLLKPERKKELKGADWGKEMSAISRLYQKYPDVEFWKQLNLFQVNSCIFFNGEAGKAEIEKQWRIYLFDKSIIAKKEKEQKSEVDSKSNQGMIVPKIENKKQTMLDWIDS